MFSLLRVSMVIAGSWDWQKGRMHGTPLPETPRAGAKPWRRDVPPRRLQPLAVALIINESLYTNNNSTACIYNINTVSVFLLLILIYS